MTSKALFREAFLVFLAVLVLVIIAAVAAGIVPFVADFLYAIVALVFVKAAQRMMDHHNHENERFGITWSGWPRGLAYGLLLTFITVPFFSVGYYWWETQALDRHFEFNTGNYFQWPSELAGEPTGWGAESSGVWVWSDKSTLNVGIRNKSDANNIVFVEADTAFSPQRRGTLKAFPVDGVAGKAKIWRIELDDSRSRGQIIIRGPRSIDIRIEPTVEGNAIWPLFQGHKAEKKDEFTANRSLWWIPLWIATQFLLIALPEEYFYRGWLQTRLEEAFEKRAEEHGRKVRTIFGFSAAIVVASVLFGLGHLLVPIGGALVPTRMSVFFPALLFGWLRRRTDSIVAPVVYHAFSNLMVIFAAVHFY